MFWVIVIAIVVIFFIAKGGNLFKSKEEVEAEKKEREKQEEQLMQKMGSSELTKSLQLFLLDKFGDLNGEEVIKLRQLAAGGGRAGYIMHVESNGIIFDLVNRKGESMDKWAISFDALGYENLPYGSADILKKILLKTLGDIPHLMVLDTGFFMYEQNRPKKSW